MPKKRQPMWDLEPYETEISVICRDFYRSIRLMKSLQGISRPIR